MHKQGQEGGVGGGETGVQQVVSGDMKVAKT